MISSGQRQRQVSRTGTGDRKAPSEQRPTEDLAVKVIVFELDPFKVTKAGVNPFP